MGDSLLSDGSPSAEETDQLQRGVKKDKRRVDSELNPPPGPTLPVGDDVPMSDTQPLAGQVVCRHCCSISTETASFFTWDDEDGDLHEWDQMMEGIVRLQREG